MWEARALSVGMFVLMLAGCAEAPLREPAELGEDEAPPPGDPPEGSGDEPLADVEVLVEGISPHHLALSGETLFFTDRGEFTGEGVIARVPAAGGDRTDLLQMNESPHTIAADAARVVFG